MKRATTVVIGAGPYGLSAAAHLKAAGLSMLIFGKPMEFWEHMPPTMYLKSSWSALSIYDPGGKHSINQFSNAYGFDKQEPVPLQVFLKYGHWFQQRVVSDVDQTYVQLLAQDGKMFLLTKWFESSVPHLYFAGSLSGYDFGPLCRHITGTRTSARQITQHILLAMYR